MNASTAAGLLLEDGFEDKGEVMKGKFLSCLRFRQLCLLCAAVAPALGLILYNGLEQVHQARLNAEHSFLITAKVIADHFQDLVDRTEHILFTLAQTPQVQSGNAAAAVTTLLGTVRHKMEGYTMLAAARPDGRLYAIHEPTFRPFSLYDRPYFRQLLRTKRFTIGEYSLGLSTGKPIIVLAQPVLDDAGELTGVLAAGLDLHWLHTILDNSSLPEAAAVTLIDRNGVILFRRPDPAGELMGKSIAATPLFQVMAGKKDGFAAVAGLRGGTSLHGFARIGGAAGTAYLTIGVPEEIALAESWRILYRNLLSLGTVLFAVLFIAWKGNETSLMRPVHRLVAFSRSLQDGDLTARAHVNNWPAELGLLADEFNTAAAALERKEQERRQTAAELAVTEQQLRRTLGELRHALGGMIKTIDSIIESRDPYTAGHQRRTAELARSIAAAMGVPEEAREGLRIAASIHDVGKIIVPTEILSRAGPLTELEFDIIRHHPQAAYDILRDIEFPWPVREIILQHHERLDGTGYPRGLRGDGISREARILAVADVVEAISHHRPHRTAHTIAAALAEISAGAGIRYDPEVVAACRRLFLSGEFSFTEEKEEEDA